MKKVEIRPDGSRRVYTVNEQPSKTDQSQAPACDVNNIMAKYKKTGQITHLARKQGVYADVSQISDLQTAIEQVQSANNAFMSIPAELRAKLNNDPVKFIEYLQDPSNDEESIKYGLKTPKQSQPTQSQSGSSSPKKQKTKTNDDDSNDDDQTPKS